MNSKQQRANQRLVVNINELEEKERQKHARVNARAHTESLKSMSHARRLGAHIGFVFKMISERTDLKTSEYAKASFQEFILRLLVA